MVDCRTDTIRRIVSEHPRISPEELFSIMGITPTMKGSKSVAKNTLTREIRTGRIIKDADGLLSLGDLSNLHTRCCTNHHTSDSIIAITEYLKEHPDSTVIDIGDAVQLTAPTVRKNLRRMGAVYVKDGKNNLWRLKE